MDFIDQGVFQRRAAEREVQRVPLAGLAPGIHQTDDVIFETTQAGGVAWAVDRMCDHASGKLVLDRGGRTATCPLHGWTLDLASRRYVNAQTAKHTLEFEVEAGSLVYERARHVLEPPAPGAFRREMTMTVRFLSHACVAIDIGGIRIVSDPWLIGPCFLTGWWHAVAPPADALEVLNSADLVYISHNHPDHLHRETLAHLRRDMPILAPDFASGSTIGPLREMGFEAVHAAAFNHVYALGETGVRAAVLQAGDFRDDSGLWVEGGGRSALLAVDSNRLNDFVLPDRPDILLTAFAGGASGYPVTFDTVSDAEKRRIATRNRAAIRDMAMHYAEAVRPRAFMPYAGFFTEAAEEDAEVKALNAKNTSAEIVAHLARVAPEIAGIDPLVTDTVTLSHDAIRSSASGGARLYEVTPAYCQGYIAAMEKAGADYDAAAIARYFEASGFADDLVLYLVPTSRDFRTPDGDAVIADFSGTRPGAETTSASSALARFAAPRRQAEPRRLLIRARKASLWHVVVNGLPWEDLSIGFQCRIDRTPDVYNSDFWFHFTNVHIGAGACAAAGPARRALAAG